MIILSLGSNLPSSSVDIFHNLELAILYLKKYEMKIINKSSYFETPSYPNEKNPKFINIAVSLESTLDPINFASVIIFIENKLERVRDKKNDPRTCDIDIIDFNNEIKISKYKDFELIVPHKELSNRNFVLFPLQEIIPTWKHPKTGEIVSTLIQKLSAEDRKSILMIKKN